MRARAVNQGWRTGPFCPETPGVEVSPSRADTLAWLDLPSPVALFRVVRRTIIRSRSRVELWSQRKLDTWLSSPLLACWDGRTVRHCAALCGT